MTPTQALYNSATVETRSDVAEIEDVRLAALAREILSEFTRADRGDGMDRPTELISRYVLNAMREATTEWLEDGTVYAEIPRFPGVWADGGTDEEALDTLREVLSEWVNEKIDHSDGDLPVVAMIDLNVI